MYEDRLGISRSHFGKDGCLIAKRCAAPLTANRPFARALAIDESFLNASVLARRSAFALCSLAVLIMEFYFTFNH
jgi:hypothetical protein